MRVNRRGSTAVKQPGFVPESAARAVTPGPCACGSTGSDKVGAASGARFPPPAFVPDVPPPPGLSSELHPCNASASTSAPHPSLTPMFDFPEP
ncbi:hypothetical protein GCM10007918_34220 [Piscinibacter gummiphilus]|nr:hypothetical protein GCM10007918_34220 [Piscinibacter gummiphilus]